jgi:hypothetical protein
VIAVGHATNSKCNGIFREKNCGQQLMQTAYLSPEFGAFYIFKPKNRSRR